MERVWVKRAFIVYLPEVRDKSSGKKSIYYLFTRGGGKSSGKKSIYFLFTQGNE